MLAAIYFYVLCLLHVNCQLGTFSACGWGFKHRMFSARRLSTSLVEYPGFLAIISKWQIQPTESTATDKHPSDSVFFSPLIFTPNPALWQKMLHHSFSISPPGLLQLFSLQQASKTKTTHFYGDKSRHQNSFVGLFFLGRCSAHHAVGTNHVFQPSNTNANTANHTTWRHAMGAVCVNKVRLNTITSQPCRVSLKCWIWWEALQPYSPQ